MQKIIINCDNCGKKIETSDVVKIYVYQKRMEICFDCLKTLTKDQFIDELQSQEKTQS